MRSSIVVVIVCIFWLLLTSISRSVYLSATSRNRFLRLCDECIRAFVSVCASALAADCLRLYTPVPDNNITVLFCLFVLAVYSELLMLG